MRGWRLLSALAASAIPFASQAVGQEPVRRVGVLRGSDVPESTKALLEGLREQIVATTCYMAISVTIDFLAAQVPINLYSDQIRVPT